MRKARSDQLQKISITLICSFFSHQVKKKPKDIVQIKKSISSLFRLVLTDEQIDLFIVHICGLTVDMFGGVLLLFDRTRPIGILILSSFHIMNSTMFSIGKTAMVDRTVIFWNIRCITFKILIDFMNYFCNSTWELIMCNLNML